MKTFIFFVKILDQVETKTILADYYNITPAGDLEFCRSNKPITTISKGHWVMVCEKEEEEE